MENIKNIELIKKYIDDYNPWHDNTQIKYFIIGNNHTDYGRYKQAIAEVSSHYNWLKNAYISQKKNDAEIHILEAEIEELNLLWWNINKAKIELKRVEIEEKELAREETEKQIKRNLNELNKCTELAEFYEWIIIWQDREKLETEYHTARLNKLMYLNTVWWWANLSWVLDIITSLPKETQREILWENNNLLTNTIW